MDAYIRKESIAHCLMMFYPLNIVFFGDVGMSEKRFIVEESENQLIIYDNDGIDDYYHLGNDERDVKAICCLLNEQQATIEQLKSVLRKECNIITDEDLLEYVKTNGVSLNE